MENTEFKTSANDQLIVKDILCPQLEDIRIACKMIANNIDELTPMLSKKETVLFQQLATRWMYGLRKHKKEVIEEMFNELNNSNTIK